MNDMKKNCYAFLDFLSVHEEEMNEYSPLAGSFAVLICSGKYLICYNTWREQWELPAGQREEHETPKQCAIRELYEETGQTVPDMEFRGLLKLKNRSNGHVKFNPVYAAHIKKLQAFRENDETSGIMLWDLHETIGSFDAVDFHLFTYVK